MGMNIGSGSGSGEPEVMLDINTTPLIDVMLVLLVIFIITAPLMTSSLRLDLPKTEATSSSDATAFVASALDAEGRATRMVMQVHDELVLEVPEAELDWARGAIPRLMAGVAALKVPLLAEVGVGLNWDEAH